MGIRCHQGGGFQVDIEENTVHRGADLVVGGGIDRAGDAFYEALGGEFHLQRILLHRLDGGVVRGREEGEGRITAGPAALEGRVGGGPDGDGLVRQFLQQVNHVTGGNGDAAFLLGIVHLDLGAERELAVGSGDFQDAAFQVEKEVFENRERCFHGNRLGNIHQSFQQLGT